MNKPFTPPETPSEAVLDLTTGFVLVDLDDGQTGLMLDDDGLNAMRGLAFGLAIAAILLALAVMAIAALRWCLQL